MTKTPLTPTTVVTVPFEDAVINYIRKGVGIDMMLKTVLNVVRLFMVYARTKGERQIYAKAADSIIECRMLCNFGRPLITVHNLRSLYSQMPPCDAALWASSILQIISCAIRIFEQFSGDMGYLQKVVISKWSRATCSFYYRFFKSFSLLFGFFAELMQRPVLKKNLATAQSASERSKARTDLIVCDALMLRNICDMIVYFKWVPVYNPYKTLEYICGLISGIIGVLLVWKDARYTCAAKAECDKKSLASHSSFMIHGGDDDGDGSGDS